MKHLSYNEFEELMKNNGETTVATNDGLYRFTGVSAHRVLIEFAFKLKKEYQIGETGFFVKFNNVVTLTKALSMYMSFE